MKQSIMILAALLVAGCHATAQIVLENEAAVVYYMPKNDLSITIEYDVIEEEPGIFYKYADRYLGTKDVITDENTTYALTQMTSQLVTTADTERAYKVESSTGLKEQLITLSEDGRLLGYNTGFQAVETKQATTLPIIKSTSSTVLMPLLEEQFIASSIAKMAEGAAKQIYRIRETRLNLLAGEVEHVPADGEAMKLVLDQLKQQEQVLTELFIGKVSVTHHSHTLVYTPQDNVESAILCRFSVHSGVVDSNDLSGEPIYITVQTEKQSLLENMQQGGKAPVLSQLYYNLPGQAHFSIEYKNNKMIDETHQIAQFGVAIPFAKQLFTAKQTPVIRINPQTGNILSIQQ